MEKSENNQLPPIEFIQKNYPGKKIKVYFPPTIYSHNIDSNMKYHKSKVILIRKEFKQIRELSDGRYSGS